MKWTRRIAARDACVFAVLAVLGGCQEEYVNVSPDECASGRKWVGGNHGSPTMHPGQDCRECHSFAVAGTVYSEAGLHDPSNCAGLEGVSILIEDAAGKMFSLESNEAGNFYLKRSQGPLKFPLTVTAESSDATREMIMPAPNGSCSSCHSESGADGAPGRITLP